MSIQKYEVFVCDRCKTAHYHVEENWKHRHIHSITVREHDLSGLPTITTNWQICDVCLRQLNDFLYLILHQK